MSKKVKKFLLIIAGPQGVGKGTVAKLLLQLYGPSALYFCTGDKARRLQAEAADNGVLIDDNIINRWVVEDLLIPFELSSEAVLGFLDGTPRTAEQAEFVYAQAMERGFVPFLIKLNAPRRMALERCEARAKIEGRADDADIAKIARRFMTYDMQTIDGLARFMELIPRDHVLQVDATPLPEEIVKNICAFLRKKEVAERQMQFVV